MRRLFAFVFVCALLACSADERPSEAVSMPASGDVTQADLSDRIGSADAPFLLDVRTPGEYAEGHVPGAVNVPHDQLAAHLSELAAHPSDEVVVYCERGGRAALAIETLEGAGFSGVRHLAGDMAGWRAAGLPTDGPGSQ